MWAWMTKKKEMLAGGGRSEQVIRKTSCPSSLRSLTIITDLAKAFQTLNSKQHRINRADLNLTYIANCHEGVLPWNLLDHAVDVLSYSIRTFSLNLTEINLVGTQFSPELFWPASKDEKLPEWHHLKRFTIQASQETADGKYLLLAADERFPYKQPPQAPTEIRRSDHLDDAIEEEPELQILLDMGLWPHYTFRLRPCSDLLTNYATAIAYAAKNMPKLEVLSFQILKSSTENEANFGFHFVAGRDRRPPRTDWFFQCGYQQLLGWEQPDEASNIWKEKCGDTLEESLITVENDSDNKKVFQRKFQDGRQTKWSSSTDPFDRPFNLYYADLVGRTRG
jgi:hypothetical protein